MVVRRRSTISGFKEANEVLKRLPERVQKRVLQNAVNAAARVSLRAIKALAPKSDEGERSESSEKYGHLLQNLRVQTLKKVRRTAKGARVWTRDAFWAVFYELGTVKQPARPFFRPGFDSSAEDALAAMRDNLGKGIEREATKLASEYGVAKKSLGVK